MSWEPRLLLWLPASLPSPSRAGQLQTFQTQRTWGEGKRGEAGSSQHSLTLSLASLYPQALLLLGLNPISASFQDQHCESLSLASNVSGESPSPSRARFRSPQPPRPGLPGPAHRAKSRGRKSREVSSLSPAQFIRSPQSTVAWEDLEVGVSGVGRRAAIRSQHQPRGGQQGEVTPALAVRTDRAEGRAVTRAPMARKGCSLCC